jgi:hypothetical protein
MFWFRQIVHARTRKKKELWVEVHIVLRLALSDKKVFYGNQYFHLCPQWSNKWRFMRSVKIKVSELLFIPPPLPHALNMNWPLHAADPAVRHGSVSRHRPLKSVKRPSFWFCHRNLRTRARKKFIVRKPHTIHYITQRKKGLKYCYLDYYYFLHRCADYLFL